MNFNNHFKLNSTLGTLTHKPRQYEEDIPDRLIKAWNTKYANKEAGSVSKSHGYIVINMKGKLYLAHRIIWQMQYNQEPNGTIDHINGDITDNRICNLRLVNHELNGKNAKKCKRNKSGITGVTHASNGKWIAQLGHQGSVIYLGRFDDINDAIYVRKQAEIQYGFHANHGR